MRRALQISILAVAATLAATATVAAETRIHHHHHYWHQSHLRRHANAGRIGYLPVGSSERGGRYQELVGDPGGAVGFYPLPYRYRVGAWRYHMREASVPPFIRNGVVYAMTMDAYRYNYAWATPANSWRYGVYDPFDGVGTPYFAGFYGPAAGDEDEPAFPFGRPYRTP